MAVIDGTKKDDRLNGTDDADRISGLAGNDVISGGGGDDVIRGGDGDDEIHDALGSDTIDAGAGNDHYFGWRSYPPGAPETVSVAMGDGDDWAYVGDSRGGVTTIDLGTGTDHLLLYDGVSATTVTTGAGSDTITFWYDYRPAATPLLITDFTAGAGGDRLELMLLLGDVLTGWKGMHNPFTGGYVRLVQDGADTLFQFDADGQRHGDQFVTLARLANVESTALTADNLSDLPPDGSAPAGLRVDDVDLTNPYAWFDGTISSDRIHGGDGSDRINGGVGNDRVWGDAGNDYLMGDAGNDRLYGGDGNDYVYEYGGSNLIDGGAGDDLVFFQFGEGTGGGGGDETISLGDGADWARYQNVRSGSLTLDMGTGNDEIELYTVQDGGARITTGSGSDLISFKWDGGDHFLAAAELTDFTAGNAGDGLDLSGWLRGAAPAWDGGNPFGEGFARLTEVDGATLVEVDRDGPGGPGGFVALARLDGVAAASLMAVNLGGFDPDAALVSAESPIHDSSRGDWPMMHLA